MKKLLLIKENNIDFREAITDLEKDYVVSQFSVNDLKSNSLENLYPDLILIFVNKINSDHYDLLRLLKHNYSEISIILFDCFGLSDYVLNSLKIGAVGYYNYNDINEKLNEIILSSFNGEITMPKLLVEDLVSPVEKFSEVKKIKNDFFTTKELIFLTLLKDSESNSFIAKKLNISIERINFLIRNIYRKLHFYYNVGEVI